MHFERGQSITLDLTDLSYLGDGVGHLDGTYVVFVAGGLPGERVVAEIVERRPRYIRARAVEILTPSASRARPPCPYFDRCGGCQVQHVDYSAQLAWKREAVRSQLRRVGHVEALSVRPTIGTGHPWNYRNNARFSVDAQGNIGFTEPKSHRHLAINACQIMQPEILALMPRLQGASPGAHQIVVRYGARTGQLLIAPNLPSLAPSVASGQQSYEEVLLGRTYRVSAPSFFQVNTRVDVRDLPDGLADRWRGPFSNGFSMAELLIALVLDRLALTGREFVVDAYCGVGTFTLPIADAAGEVIGIEEARSAVSDAEFNGRHSPNARFVVGRTEDVLSKLERRPDAVVLDPSRLGCDPEVLGALGKLRASTIVYVSCDAATLARDLGQLVAAGYNLVDVQPVDMFPQTHHVETVSLLRHSAA